MGYINGVLRGCVVMTCDSNDQESYVVRPVAPHEFDMLMLRLMES